VRAIKLNQTWQHRRSLLARFGATILAVVSVGCAATDAPAIGEVKMPQSREFVDKNIAQLDESHENVRPEPSLEKSNENALKIYTSQGPVFTDNFSTEGRPKMSFETPSGSKMIYNPAMDPEFIDKLEAYRSPCENGSLMACQNARRYIEYFMLLQDTDIVDNGCSGFTRTNITSSYIVAKGQNLIPPYPAGYFNPFEKFYVSNTYSRAKWDQFKNDYILINGRKFIRTEFTKITSTFFSSKTFNYSDVFEFECLIWAS